jgi:hypothetical protein
VDYHISPSDKFSNFKAWTLALARASELENLTIESEDNFIK